MAIKNVSRIDDELTNTYRSMFEHRATWLYFLLDEARKRGLDWDDFARKAIFRCGCFHGQTKFSATEDLKKFAGEFANDVVRKVFEMEIKEMSDDRFVVEFNYCPLVAAWMKQTDNEEDIAHLCDIAMDGDRGIISMFRKFEFDLQDTIAKGGNVCRIVITKKE